MSLYEWREQLDPRLRKQLLQLGTLVEVAPCKHGNYARHIDGDTVTATGPVSYWTMCNGKPEEDNDD